jgi:hypothetical protein
MTRNHGSLAVFAAGLLLKPPASMKFLALATFLSMGLSAPIGLNAFAAPLSLEDASPLPTVDGAGPCVRQSYDDEHDVTFYVITCSSTGQSVTDPGAIHGPNYTLGPIVVKFTVYPFDTKAKIELTTDAQSIDWSFDGMTFDVVGLAIDDYPSPSTLWTAGKFQVDCRKSGKFEKSEDDVIPVSLLHRTRIIQLVRKGATASAC